MEKKEKPKSLISSRQKLVDIIHNTITDNNISISNIVLALAQVMTDVGLTLWNQRADQLEQTNRVTPQLLALMETEHYQSPMLDTALSLTASQMICWVHDSEQINNEY